MIWAIVVGVAILVFQNCSGFGNGSTSQFIPQGALATSAAPTPPLFTTPFIPGPSPTATPTSTPVVVVVPTPPPNNDAQAMEALTELIATVAPQLVPLGVDPTSFYGVSPAAILDGSATPASIAAAAANVEGQINNNSDDFFFVDDGTLDSGIAQCQTAIGQLTGLLQTPLSPLVADEVTANIQILQVLEGAMADNL
jgi:hypothetical protein